MTKQGLFKIFALCLAFAGSLFVAELALQILDLPKHTWSPWVSDDHTGFRFGSNLDQQMITEEYNVHIATNESGLRDEPLTKKDKFRILMLGDSFTFGYGVSRGDLFADRLESSLGVDVINAGTGGYDLINHAQFLKYYGPDFQPDLIVHMLYLGNDILYNDRWSYQGENISRGDAPTVRSHRDIKIISLLKLVRHSFRYLNHHKKEWALPEKYLNMAARDLGQESKQNYLSAHKLYLDMVSISKALGVPYVTVIIPYKTMVEKDSQMRIAERHEDKLFWDKYDLTRPQKEVIGWAHESNVPVLDLTGPLRAAYEETRRPLFYYKDGHLNADGHQLVARLLHDFLKDRVSSPAT